MLVANIKKERKATETSEKTGISTGPDYGNSVCSGKRCHRYIRHTYSLAV